MSDKFSIKEINKEVNMSFQQAKQATWSDIGKFIIHGFFKLLFTIVSYGALFWIIRHI